VRDEQDQKLESLEVKLQRIIFADLPFGRPTSAKASIILAARGLVEVARMALASENELPLSVPPAAPSVPRIILLAGAA